MAVKPPRLPVKQPSPLLRVRPAARGRRLSDKIRVAFHAACDEGAFEIAERLLNQLDALTRRPPILPSGVDRRRPESLAALDERLANLLLWRAESGQLMMAADRKFAAKKSNICIVAWRDDKQLVTSDIRWTFVAAICTIGTGYDQDPLYSF